MLPFVGSPAKIPLRFPQDSPDNLREVYLPVPSVSNLMNISPISAAVSLKPPAFTQFAQKLAATLGSSLSLTGQEEANVIESPSVLTPGRIKSILMEMGVSPDAQNQAIGEAFARLGLALTRESLAEAHLALALAPEASPRAYALALSWSLPASPAILNALTSVTREAATNPEEALPQELLSWLGLAADASADTEELAAHLFLMTQGIGKSTENRILQQKNLTGLTTVQDARSTLLRLSEGSADRVIQHGANTMATHLEGQQLINQVIRRDSAREPFYLSIPVLLGTEASLAEMRLGVWDDEQDTAMMDPQTGWLTATVRLSTKRLGRMQITLRGTLAGRLMCRACAEKSATVRLLQRHASALALALAGSGDWQVQEIECRQQAEWPPLWHGSEAFTAPRTCIDWRA
jgi:hypothetical protein